LSDGGVKCWGTGYLGNGVYSTRATAVAVSGITNAVAISGTCALLANGEKWCWGSSERATPTPVAGISNAVAIDGNCAVLASGELKCGAATPVLVDGIDDAVGVSTGGNNICVRLRNHQVQCWGSNGNGQLSLPAGVDSVLAPLLPVAL
jgi:hypothetical protein